MDANYKMGYPEVPLSITNKTVDKQFATDASNPFTLLEFIKIVSSYTNSTDITDYYNHYVLKWNSVKTSTQVDTNKQIVDAYTSFIKEISLNYTAAEEQQYLKNIDFTNPNDLDVALSFIGRKIKDIALYYSKHREDIKLEAVRKKLKGSNKGATSSIKEIIVNFFTNKLSKDQSREIIENLEVTIGERYNTSSFFNKTPNDNNYNDKDRDYNLDIFLRSNSDLVAEAFTQSTEAFKQVNEAEAIFDNKRELTKKYMGADFFYLSASPIISNIPVIDVNTEYNIAYNRQVLIQQILDTQVCTCIEVQGPSTYTALKCGATTYTSVSVNEGVYYDCVTDVFDIIPSSSVKRGKKCSSVFNCTTAPPTTSTTTTLGPPEISITTTVRPVSSLFVFTTRPPRTTTKAPGGGPDAPDAPDAPDGEDNEDGCKCKGSIENASAEPIPSDAENQDPNPCITGYTVTYDLVIDCSKSDASEISVLLQQPLDIPAGNFGNDADARTKIGDQVKFTRKVELSCEDIKNGGKDTVSNKAEAGGGDGTWAINENWNYWLYTDGQLVAGTCVDFASDTIDGEISDENCCKNTTTTTTSTTTTTTTTTTKCPPCGPDVPGTDVVTTTSTTTTTTTSTTPAPGETTTTGAPTTTCEPCDGNTGGVYGVKKKYDVTTTDQTVDEATGSGTQVTPSSIPVLSTTTSEPITD
jgi:hypothetical protein